MAASRHRLIVSDQIAPIEAEMRAERAGIAKTNWSPLATTTEVPMTNRNLTCPYDRKVVEALAKFFAFLESEGPRRVFSCMLSHGADDRDMGGVLGVDMRIHLSDDECEEVEEMVEALRGKAGGAHHPLKIAHPDDDR